MPELVDVSHYQDLIDWPKVKDSGIAAVYVKVTQGTSYVDPTAEAKIVGARSVGLPVGVYHFANPRPGNVILEADHFVDVAKGMIGLGLSPMLDMEDETTPLSKADLTKWNLDFLGHVFARWTEPGIYTGRYFVNARMNPDPALANFRLWIAHWTTAGAPTLPAPWNSWVLWQYGGSAVPGISGNVDRDRCPSLVPLIVGGNPQPVPTPVPQPEDDMIPQRLYQVTDDGPYKGFVFLEREMFDARHIGSPEHLAEVLWENRTRPEGLLVSETLTPCKHSFIEDLVLHITATTPTALTPQHVVKAESIVHKRDQAARKAAGLERGTKKP